METARLVKRNEVKVESTWDQERLYPSWDAWQVDFDRAVSGLSELSEFTGKLNQGPQRLRNWFDTFNKYYHQVYKLWKYTHMAVIVDNKDEKAKGHHNQANSLYAKFFTVTAFAIPELQEIGAELFEWVGRDPGLADYKHYVDNLIRLEAYVRSAEVEEILGMIDSPITSVYLTYSELTNSDITFIDAVDSEGNSHPVRQSSGPPSGLLSPDREYRRTTWESYSDSYLAMQNTLASNYIAMNQYYQMEANIRGYDSVLEMRLTPSNLPVEVFHNLVDNFKKHLYIFHRYWEVKRKIIKVKQIHPYDIWAPIVDQTPVIPYHQAVDWICKALAPLGDDYVGIISRGCHEDHWVDYAPNEGKSQGAASALAIGDVPPYIYLTYQDDINSFSTLAHETGHSLQHHYQNQHLPFIYSDFRTLSSAVAETASNFHQAMTRQYLQTEKHGDRLFQIAILDEALHNLHRYLFIMPTLSRFEYEVFDRLAKDEPLNASILNSIMVDLFSEGYGDTLEDDPQRTAITWAQFPHLYTPFYTFQYAVGISAALALADGIYSGMPDAAEDYIEFLKRSAAMYPMDAWKLAGVDMSRPEPIERAFAVLSNIIDQLEILAT